MENAVSEEQQWQTQIIEDFIQVVKAPYGDFDSIGRLYNSTGDRHSLQLIVDFISQTPQGKQAFQERHRLGKIDLEKLHELPKNTFGYHYAVHMLSNGLKPLEAKQIPEDDISFLTVHITETHDIWHTVMGYSTHITGEIELQAFYVAQLSASRFWLAMLSKNLLKAALQDIQVSGEYMDALCRGWLRGKQAKPLFGIQWNLMWEKPLEELRDRFNLRSEIIDTTVVARVA